MRVASSLLSSSNFPRRIDGSCRNASMAGHPPILHGDTAERHGGVPILNIEFDILRKRSHQERDCWAVIARYGPATTGPSTNIDPYCFRDGQIVSPVRPRSRLRSTPRGSAVQQQHERRRPDTANRIRSRTLRPSSAGCQFRLLRPKPVRHHYSPCPHGVGHRYTPWRGGCRLYQRGDSVPGDRSSRPCGVAPARAGSGAGSADVSHG
jgi:hypothetical protein